jgi:hypothetical protein
MSKKRALTITDAFDRIRKRQCPEVPPYNTINVMPDFTPAIDVELVSTEQSTLSSQTRINATEIHPAEPESPLTLKPGPGDICNSTDSNISDPTVKSLVFVYHHLCQKCEF